MTDNVPLPVTTEIIHADEYTHATFGVGKTQLVKVTWGAPGTGNDVDTATGKAFPAQLRSATGLIPLGEPTDAKNAATDTTSVAIIPILKQLSAELQLLRIALGSTALDLSIGTGGSRTLRVAMDSSQALPTVAHDTADSGDPIKMGGKAQAAEITPVTAGDRANLITDLVGKLITLPYANPENFINGAITTPMTGTTSTSLVGAPGAGLRNYITTIIVSNAHASVGTDIIIQDGSGGTTLLTIPAAAVYGGAVITLPTPLRQPTANTALFCANVTTGASTKASAIGYKGA